MNWEAIGALGEVFGALAVLVTLVYLAAQVRQNTATVAAGTYDSLLNEINHINIAIAQDEDLASIVYRGMYEPESLSDLEGIRFQFVMRGVFNQWLKMYRLYENGAVSRAEFELYGMEISQVLGTPGGKIFKAGHKIYAEVFAAVEELEVVQATAFRLQQDAAEDGPAG